MIGVPWLKEAMEKAGFEYNKDLAQAAGVSPATVGNALQRGEVRESTAEKLQTACGDHLIGPLLDPNKVASEKGSLLWNPPTMEEKGCAERFEGSDCPTTSAECAGCWNTLNEMYDSKDLPFSRAQCRLEHGWTLSGGLLTYRTIDGREIAADEIMEYRNAD